MPKAGTGWFYDQLSHHPDFWMPPAKELHYLDRDFPRVKNSVQMLQNWDKAVRRARRRGIQWGERERSFLTELASSAGEARDIDRYAGLFRYKGDLLSGDVSPGYCTIEDEGIREIAAKLPEAKIVLLIREPISRVWSRICMAERDGEFDVSLLDDPTKFAGFIASSRFVDQRFSPTRIIRRWSSHYPSDARFRVVLFDDIVQRPDETVREILAFVGADHSKGGGLPADYNRKSRSRKLQMPESIRKVLVEYFGEEVRACAELLGGAARAWPDVHGMETSPA